MSFTLASSSIISGWRRITGKCSKKKGGEWDERDEWDSTLYWRRFLGLSTISSFFIPVSTNSPFVWCRRFEQCDCRLRDPLCVSLWLRPCVLSGQKQFAELVSSTRAAWSSNYCGWHFNTSKFQFQFYPKTDKGNVIFLTRTKSWAVLCCCLRVLSSNAYTRETTDERVKSIFFFAFSAQIHTHWKLGNLSLSHMQET